MTNAELLISLACYLTIITFIVVAGFTIVGSIAFCRTEKGSAKTFSLLMRRANALQMLTVILIVLVVAVLRLTDSLAEAAVISLLSGVAGYVLGSTGRIDSQRERDSVDVVDLDTKVGSKEPITDGSSSTSGSGRS